MAILKYNDSNSYENVLNNQIVTSANGYTGIVELSNTDIGAAAKAHSHSISNVVSLSNYFDNFYYDSGDTITISYNEGPFAGMITSSTTQLFFEIPLQGVVRATGIQYVSGKLVGRSDSGYLNSAGYSTGIDISGSAYTVTCVLTGRSSFNVSVKKSAAYTNVSNNHMVMVNAQISNSLVFQFV